MERLLEGLNITLLQVIIKAVALSETASDGSLSRLLSPEESSLLLRAKDSLSREVWARYLTVATMIMEQSVEEEGDDVSEGTTEADEDGGETPPASTAEAVAPVVPSAVLNIQYGARHASVSIKENVDPKELRGILAASLGVRNPEDILGVEFSTQSGGQVSRNVVPLGTLCKSPLGTADMVGGAKVVLLLRRQQPAPQPSAPPSTAAVPAVRPSAPPAEPARAVAPPDSGAVSLEVSQRVLTGMLRSLKDGGMLAAATVQTLEDAVQRGEGDAMELNELRFAMIMASEAARGGANVSSLGEACLGLLVAAAHRLERRPAAEIIPPLTMAAKAVGVDFVGCMGEAMKDESRAVQASRARAFRWAMENSADTIASILLIAVVSKDADSVTHRLRELADLVIRDVDTADLQGDTGPSAAAAPAAEVEDEAAEPEEAPSSGSEGGAGPARLAAMVATYLHSKGRMAQPATLSLVREAEAGNAMLVAAWEGFLGLVTPHAPPDAPREWFVLVACGELEGTDPRFLTPRRALWSVLQALGQVYSSVEEPEAPASEAVPDAELVGHVQEVVAVAQIMVNHGILEAESAGALLDLTRSKLEGSCDAAGSAIWGEIGSAVDQYRRDKASESEESAPFAALLEAVARGALRAVEWVKARGGETAAEEPEEEVTERVAEEEAAEGLAEGVAVGRAEGDLDNTGGDDWPQGTVASHLSETHTVAVSGLHDAGLLTADEVGRLNRRWERRDPAIRAIWRHFLSSQDSGDLLESLALLGAMPFEEEEAPAQTQAEDEQMQLSALLRAGSLSEEEAAVLGGMVAQGDPRVGAVFDVWRALGQSTDATERATADADAADTLRTIARAAVENPLFSSRYTDQPLVARALAAAAAGNEISSEELTRSLTLSPTKEMLAGAKEWSRSGDLTNLVGAVRAMPDSQ
jgi:hypothetical protein